MTKKLLVDYHFHPNLSKHTGRAITKCRAIWQAFSDKKLDVVIITEHVFKNPTRAYQLLLDTKPPNHPTQIFPGLEGLTKEGVDIICFAETTMIYSHQKLMVPKQLSVEEMIKYIQTQSGIYASIPHPYGPGHSGIMRRLGESEGRRLMAKLGAVEVSNACFRGGKKVADFTGISKLLKTQRRYMDYTTHLPDSILQSLDCSLYTGGSDAHVLVEIGSGLLVPTPADTKTAGIFTALTHNTSKEFVETPGKIQFWLGLYKLYSIIIEALTKAFRLYEGRIYQQDDQFTNFYSEAEKETVLAIRKQHGVIVKPILNSLTYFGFTPATLNVVSLVAMLFSFVLVTAHPLAGAVLFCIYLTSANLIGALARYQHIESEAGAIMKVARQYLVVFAAILAGIGFHLIDAFWGALYLGLYIILLWLIIVLNQIGQPIRLVVRSKLVVVAAMFLYVLSNINIINQVVVGFSLYMMVMNGWMLLRYRRATAIS